MRMKNTESKSKSKTSSIDEEKRDFLFITTAGLAIAGSGAVGWSLIDTMNPSKDVLALSTTEVDLSPLEEGQSLTVMWRGKPIFIRHRTNDEITMAGDVSVDDLIHKETDESRVKNPKWLIVVGVCSHLGCVPLGQKIGDSKGEYGGWFCPCHGSHYDLSGRIRKGPAPKNMEIPKFEFVDNNTIKIG